VSVVKVNGIAAVNDIRDQIESLLA